jgi:hypothetical protein
LEGGPNPLQSDGRRDGAFSGRGLGLDTTLLFWECSPGANTTIIASPTGQTEPRGINNNGIIAGTDLGLGGVVINGPNYVPLNISGSSVFGLNDDLELAGFYTNGPEDFGMVLDAPH